MLRRITHELKHHAPFTMGGTLTGLVLMVVMVYAHASHGVSHVLFAICHPGHVLLSAVVTTAMYRRYGKGRWWAVVLIGYVGSIGIATVSDSLIPYVGETLLRLPEAHVHAGFLEEWYIVNPAALLGIAIAFVWPTTEFPHAGHVLLSTWASTFHMTMAMGKSLSLEMILILPAFLFIAVWLPCCTSDIVFPLLFVRREDRPPCEHCCRKAGKKVE